MKHYLVIAAAALAFSAATPTGNTRHLEYAFETYPMSGIGGGQGTVVVDFVGKAADGGTVVRTTDEWQRPWRADRPHATEECEIYQSGSVSCTQPPYGLSLMQQALLPLLAQGFLEGTGTWTRSFKLYQGPDLSTFATVAQLHEEQSTTPGRASIRLDGTENWANFEPQVAYASVSAAVEYDAQAGVPTSVRTDWRDIRSPLRGSGYVQLTLTKDTH